MSEFMTKAFFVFLVFLSSVCHADVKSVQVFDGDFNPISIIESDSEISEFNVLWNTKIKTDAEIEVDWSLGYKLDLTGNPDGGRWIYYEGWLMPLSAKSQLELYRIDSYEQFELLFSSTHRK